MIRDATDADLPIVRELSREFGREVPDAPHRDDDTEETLSTRILAEEHRIYAEAVRIVLEGKYKIVGRRVVRTS